MKILTGTFTALGLIIGIVNAQKGPISPPISVIPSNSTTIISQPTQTGTVNTQHVVTVSPANDLIFQPSTIKAVRGDTVIFIFMSTEDHSVTQSSFTDPCTPLLGGFNSGLVPGGSAWSLEVIDDITPIWFYCQQTTPVKHCGTGMVGAINPPASGNTFPAFQSAAIALGDNEGPQTPVPNLSGVGAFATFSPTSIGTDTGFLTSTSPSTSNSNSPSTSTSLSSGGSGTSSSPGGTSTSPSSSTASTSGAGSTGGTTPSSSGTAATTPSTTGGNGTLAPGTNSKGQNRSVGLGLSTLIGGVLLSGLAILLV